MWHITHCLIIPDCYQSLQTIKMSVSKQPAGCSYCRNIPGSDWQSHSLKNGMNVVVCPTVIERNTCKYCKLYGHKIKDCPKVAEKKKREQATIIKLNADFPPLSDKAPKAPGGEAPTVSVAPPVSYSGKAIKNRPEHIVAKLEKEHKDHIQAEKEKKQKKHEDWLKREEEREKQAEIEKQRCAARHVQAMYDKYGTTWYRWVEQTAEDCDEAYDLREKEAEDEYRREYEIKQYCKEQEAYYEKMEQELTPEEFQDWEWERDEEYFDNHYAKEASFNTLASNAARCYYAKHGLMLPDGDFVSDEWGAERKIDKVLRERRQNEQK